MKNTKQDKTQSIANLDQLQSVLGVKMEKKTRTSKTLTQQAQVMQQVKNAMHELLVTKFPQYYKEIETDVIVTSKEGENKLQRISGYYLLFDKVIDVNGEQHKGFKICKPTTYVKGGNSYTCLYFKEVGKTTINK